MTSQSKKEYRMRSDAIIDVMVAKVKNHLKNHTDHGNAALTAIHARTVTQSIMVAVMEAAVDGFKTCIQEIRENPIAPAPRNFRPFLGKA